MAETGLPQGGTVAPAEPEQPTKPVAGAPHGSATKGEPKPSPELETYLREDVTDPATGKVIETEPTPDFKLDIPERFKEEVPDDEQQAYVDVVRNVLRREGPNVKPNVLAQALLQELTNKNLELGSSKASAMETENEQAVQEQVLAWKREIATDPQLGGTKYTQSMVTAEEGARRLGGHAAAVAFIRHLRGEEVMSGPMLVRMFNLAATTMREDRIHGLIMNKGTQQKTLAEALYGGKKNNAGGR